MRLMVWRFTQTAIATLLSSAERKIASEKLVKIAATMPFTAALARPNVNIDDDLIQRKHDRRFVMSVRPRF